MTVLFLAILAACRTVAAQSKPSIVPAASTIVNRPNSSLQPLQLYDASRYACPMDCDQSGLISSAWTVYHETNRLSFCNSTMLLDFAIFNPLNDPDTHTTIRACAFGATNNATMHENISLNATASRIAKRRDSSTDSCVSSGYHKQVSQSLQIAFNGSKSSTSLVDFNAATYQLANYLASQNASSCQQVIIFAYSNTVAVGLYVGSALQSQGVAASVLQKFIESTNSGNYFESNMVQLCSDQSSRFSMGIIANANADLAAVQNSVATWASGDCVNTYDHASVLANVPVTIPTIAPNSTFISANGSTSRNETHQAARKSRALWRRGDCTTVKVASGDSCKYAKEQCGFSSIDKILVEQVRVSQLSVALRLRSSPNTIQVRACAAASHRANMSAAQLARYQTLRPNLTPTAHAIRIWCSQVTTVRRLHLLTALQSTKSALSIAIPGAGWAATISRPARQCA